MTYKWKTFGLILVTIAVSVSGGASIAQGANGTLVTTLGGTVKLLGHQTNVHEFKFTDHPIGGDYATATCTTATFEPIGSTNNGATTFTLEPKYVNCTLWGLAGTITNSGCNYVYHVRETIGGSGIYDGAFNIVCTGGGKLTFKTLTCELKIETHTTDSTLEFINSGKAGFMDLKVVTNFGGIVSTVVIDGLGCPLSGTGIDLNGDYFGETTIAGISDQVTLHD